MCLTPSTVTMALVPQTIKPTPLKFCAACGTKLERKRLKNGQLESLLHFSRRPYCDRACMAAGFRAKPKTGSPSWMTAHLRARQLKPSGPCESCGSSRNVDVHHRDGDWQNNALENLQRLCRSCHNKQHRKRASCMVCGEPAKGLGYCEKHYQRFKKWGDPLMVKHNQHTPVQRMSD